MTRLRSSLVLMLVTAAAACGDNKAAPDAVVSPDAPPDGPPNTHPFAVAVAGDYTPGDPGVLSLINPLTDVVRGNAVAGVAGDDPFIRQINGKLYVINRSDTSSVTILDAATLAVNAQISTGAMSNPQDVAVVGTKLYLPALGTKGVVVVDASMPANPPTTIDLSSLDPDGLPDCVSIYRVGTLLYVACGLLDDTKTNKPPRGPGKVAIIDTSTGTDTFMPSLTITLPFDNPQNMIMQSPADSMFGGDLLVPLVPDFSVYTTGCLARIKPGATPTANGCAINNSDLAGYVSHVDIATPADGSETLWIATSAFDAKFNSLGNLRPFDLKAGTLGAPISASTEAISDVAACTDGSVVASDVTTTTPAGNVGAGIRVFSGGVEKTTAPLAIGLTPSFGNGLVCYDNAN